MTRSPLRARHEEARRFHDGWSTTATRLHLVRFPGRGGIAWPLLALQARRDLGVCRHVLAQRIVAGCLAVHLPWEGAGISHPSQLEKESSE